MGDDAQVRAMVRHAGEELGRVDILVANAAATAFKPLLELKPHHLTRTFNLSVGGFVAAVQESARFMGAGGRVVMISGIDSIRYLPPAMAHWARPSRRWRTWCATSPSSSAHTESRSTASTSR